MCGTHEARTGFDVLRTLGSGMVVRLFVHPRGWRHSTHALTGR